jgi:hypothetical protein
MFNNKRVTITITKNYRLKISVDYNHYVTKNLVATADISALKKGAVNFRE